MFCFGLASVRDGLLPISIAKKTPWGQGPKADNFGGVQNKEKYGNVFLVHFPNHNTLLASSNLQVRDVSKHFVQKHCSSEFSFFSKPQWSLLYYLS